MFMVEGKEMKASFSLMSMNQLSKTILQSCSTSLISSLEYCPSADENVSNMTSPILIYRHSDKNKELMPTTKSGCISRLSLYKFDISHTCTF